MTPSQKSRQSPAPAAGSRRSGRTSASPHGRSGHLGIDADDRRGVCSILSAFVADQHVLYQKTRLCHWNLVGGRFDPLHAMFDAQYRALAEAIDATAERIRMLDGVAPASLGELGRAARLPELDGCLVEGGTALAVLLADHETCAVTLRADIERVTDHGDVGTADLLTGLLREHEKTAWMLRSHLATERGGDAAQA